MNAQIPPTAEQLIAKYIELRAYCDDKVKALDEQLKPYKAGMEQIQGAMLALLNEQGGQAIKTAAGTSYRSTVTKFRLADRNVFEDFLVDKLSKCDSVDEFRSYLAFFTSALAKEPLQEYIDHNSAVPPGVDVTTVYSVNFRKPSA